jgi:hypothetical protein
MSLKNILSIAVLSTLIFSTGGAFARDSTAIMSRNSSGHLETTFGIVPMADGSFDEYVHFNSEELRSISTD